MDIQFYDGNLENSIMFVLVKSIGLTRTGAQQLGLMT